MSLLLPLLMSLISLLMKVFLNQSVPNQWINHILPFNEDTEMTCRDIREGNAPLSEIIHKMCPYILSASPSDEGKS